MSTFLGSIQLRYKTAAAWVAENRILLRGEPGYETDTLKLKIGDGASPWNILGYASGNSDTLQQSITNEAAARAAGDAALQTSLTAAVAGTAAPVASTFTTIIKLDLVQGRDYGTHVVSTNEVYTIDPTAVVNGTALVTLIGDSSHTPDFTAFQNPQSFTFDNTKSAELAFFYRNGVAYMYGSLGPAVDATVPTLLTASVANATPTRIDLVWSEPINADISASTAFAVSSGHSLTAHTYVDSTHTYLTTSTAFVASETKTLAYTQPGSSKMRDIAGNLLANIASKSITDNVAAAASLAIGTGVTQSDLTISTLTGLDEWVVYSGSSPSFAFSGSKTATILNNITASLYGGATDNTTLGVETISWTDSNGGAGGSPTGNNQEGNGFGIARSKVASGPSEAGVRLASINVDTSVRKFRVYCRTINWSGNQGMKIRATLADASAGPVVATAFNSGDTAFYYEITVNAGSSTTMQVDAFPSTASTGAQICVVGIAATH